MGVTIVSGSRRQTKTVNGAGVVTCRSWLHCLTFRKGTDRAMWKIRMEYVTVTKTNGSLGRKSHFHIFSYLSAAPCLAARFPAKKDITTTQPNPHHHK